MDNDLVSLREHLAALLTRAWVVLLCVLAAAAAAYAISVQRPSEYQASADVLITPYDLKNAAVTSLTSEEISTEVNVIESDVILRPVFDALGPNEPLDDFEARVDVEARGDASIARITVTRPTAGEATQVANEIADAYLSFRDERRPDTAVSGSGGLILSLAERPNVAASPRPVRAGLLGGVLGLVVGVGLALALSGRSREAELRLSRLPETANAPLLMSVPGRRNQRSRGIAHHSTQVQAYCSAARLLAAGHLDALDRHRPASVVVTSAGRKAGRTTVAVNLAAALAGQGRRVLLVDAETHRPRIALCFGVTKTTQEPEATTSDESVSSTSSPDETASPETTIYSPGDARGSATTTGTLPETGRPSTTEVRDALPERPVNSLPEVAPRLRLLVSKRPSSLEEHGGEHISLARLLRQVEGDVDVVVVDSPALLDDALGLDLVRASDVVLLVQPATERDDGPFIEAVRRITHLDQEIAGVVVTGGR